MSAADHELPYRLVLLESDSAAAPHPAAAAGVVPPVNPAGHAGGTLPQSFGASGTPDPAHAVQEPRPTTAAADAFNLSGGFGPVVDPLGPRLVEPAPVHDPALRVGAQ